MDKPELCKLLGVEPYGTFYFHELRLKNWGAEIVLDGYYEHVEPQAVTSFRLILEDCREMQWRVYAHLRPLDDVDLPATMMVNLSLGQNHHRKPLHLLTDAFGISIYYGELRLEPF